MNRYLAFYDDDGEYLGCIDYVNEETFTAIDAAGNTIDTCCSFVAAGRALTVDATGPDITIVWHSHNPSKRQ
jgi:hypothetical protein